MLKCVNTGTKIRKRHIHNIKLKFWLLCIPLRIILGIIILFIDIKIVAPITLIAGIFSLLANLSCIKDPTKWWSISFEIVISLLLCLFSILVLAGILTNNWIIAAIIWFDVIIGALQALVKGEPNGKLK